MNKDLILSRLDKRNYFKEYLPNLKENGRSQAMAKCLWHDDRNPSLSVNLESGLYRCFACGASGDLINFHMTQNGMDFETALADLCRVAGIVASPSNSHGKVVATYEYKDTDGNVLHVKERIEPGRNGRKKEFVFKHLADGKWAMGRGCEPVPYNLPALAKSKYVLVVEGEGKVETLREWGFTAACLDSGSQSPWHNDYLPYFENKEKITILPDSDTTGREYATRIASALYGKVGEIKVVELPGLAEKGDIVDWKEAGGTKEELLGLIKEAPLWKSTAVPASKTTDGPKRGQAVVNGRLCYKTRKGYLIAGEYRLHGKGESSHLYRFSEEGIERYLAGEKPKMSDVYDRILEELNDYFIWKEPYLPHAVALWVIGTYFAALFDWYPYLWINSPTKRCGKTRLLDLANRLVFNGSDIQVSPTPAILYRQADKEFPTLLIDEFEKMAKDIKQDLLGILNQGARYGGTVARCQPNTHEIKYYNVYCPKVLAGISRLSDTLADRVLEIQMARKKPGEKLKRFNAREVTKELRLLRDDLYLVGLGYDERIYEEYRQATELTESLELPDTVDDRLLDSVEPLFILAGIISVEKGSREVIDLFKRFVLSQANTRSTADEGDSIQAAIRVLAGQELEEGSRIFTSQELLDLFREEPALDWCERRNQAQKLINKLSFYSHSHTVHGKSIRGYKITSEAIKDLRERYGE